jgi:hypothetical protein
MASPKRFLAHVMRDSNQKKASRFREAVHERADSVARYGCVMLAGTTCWSKSSLLM